MIFNVELFGNLEIVRFYCFKKIGKLPQKKKKNLGKLILENRRHGNLLDILCSADLVADFPEC